MTKLNDSSTVEVQEPKVCLNLVGGNEQNIRSISRYQEDESETSQRTDRSAYLTKVKLLFKLFSSFSDQIYDFFTIALLRSNGYYGFAFLFIFADLCPALSIMWETYKEEKSLKVVRFGFQPFNLFFWNIRALLDDKYTQTFLMIRSVHSTLEAPLQILLTLTMMSMGIIELPGSIQRHISNAYNFSIDLSWWPVFTVLLSFTSILFGTRGTFSIVANETSHSLGFVLFLPVFIYRMLVWIIICILLERFALLLIAIMISMNTVVLFCSQRSSLISDPLNCGCLSVVIPTWSMKAINSQVQSQEVESNGLRMLFWLVATGNTFLLLSYLIIYTLYYTGVYNPWCNEDLSQLLFEEELFMKSLAFFSSLFLAATLPLMLTYMLRHQRLSKWKLILVGTAVFAFGIISCITITKSMIETNYAPSILSTKKKIGSSDDLKYTGWSEWKPLESMTGYSRARQCGDFVLDQRNEFSKIAVALGLRMNSVEVIDLSAWNEDCKNLAKFPHKTSFAVGGLGSDEVPVICGGEHSSHGCYSLKNGEWKQSFHFNEARSTLAMTRSPFPSDGSQFFVVGGIHPSIHILNSSEVLTADGWKLSVTFPVEIDSHCMVKINSTSVMVIGGYQGPKNKKSSNTYIFNSEQLVWTKGPDFVDDRTEHSCAMIKDSNESKDRSVVVTGGKTVGINFKLNYLQSTYFYGVETSGRWQKGPDLPQAIIEATLIEDPSGGVVLIGGQSQDGQLLNNIYRLPFAEKGSKWVEIKQKLKTARKLHTAFFVPDKLTTCTRTKSGITSN